VAYGGNWPSVPVPNITTNIRFGSAARHALLAVVSSVAPRLGCFFFTGHLGPARTAGPFYFGRGVFLGSVTLEMYKEFHHQASVTERPVAL